VDIVPEDIQNAPQKEMDKFVSLTTVQKMITNALVFYKEEFPKLRTEIKNQGLQIKECFLENANTKHEI
jgi:hypothetical protein